MFRDRIIVGEKLLEYRHFTLSRCVEICRAYGY